MNRKEIWPAIELELRKAKKKFPGWPDHVAAQSGIVCSAAGAIMNNALDYKYGKLDQWQAPQRKEDMMKAAIHTAAMAIRFLENLK